MKSKLNQKQICVKCPYCNNDFYVEEVSKTKMFTCPTCGNILKVKGTEKES